MIYKLDGPHITAIRLARSCPSQNPLDTTYDDMYPEERKIIDNLCKQLKEGVYNDFIEEQFS